MGMCWMILCLKEWDELRGDSSKEMVKMWENTFFFVWDFLFIVVSYVVLVLIDGAFGMLEADIIMFFFGGG